jgi:hypothetical protein
MMSDELTLLKESDRIVLLNDPPNLITVWNEVIRQADPRWLTETPDGYLVFTFTNVELKYRIVARSPVFNTVMAILVSAEPA